MWKETGNFIFNFDSCQSNTYGKIHLHFKQIQHLCDIGSLARSRQSIFESPFNYEKKLTPKKKLIHFFLIRMNFPKSNKQKLNGNFVV